MTDRETDLLEVIDAIDPAALDYQEWAQIGMGLKHEGHTASDWDRWSQRDSRRYHAGECFRKWDTFRGSDKPVTGGTIVAIARDHGWRPPARDTGYALDWDSVIGPREDKRAIVADVAWVEGEDITEPDDATWDATGELIRYLETLFEAGENVGYVTGSWEKDGRYLPKKGNYDRTAGELIHELSKSRDFGRVFGDFDEAAGAWIRFNPLDGRGVKNENVTEFRYALVESDDMPVAQQNAIIRQLELPVAALVHSGGKSLHAIVRVDAPDYDEYRKRVDYLYDFCKKNKLALDTQNKNPSRLSRMPGVTRNGRKQFLADTNIGKANWAEWRAWVDEAEDVLPVDVTDFSDEWDEEIPAEASVVDGMLAENEKMMLAGPAKAGKTVALLELACAVASGGTWFGAKCEQGDALFVNFELKRESRIRRVKQIYEACGYSRESAGRLHFLDLRGHSAPLEQLISKIVRQTVKYQCSLLVLDPIYKIMQGDENNAEAVGAFCNQLDSLGRQLGCSIVYCHHYSKGQQGQKSSMDRASGSGVFARDADALLAMTELEVTKEILAAYVNHSECAFIPRWLEEHGHAGVLEDVPQDVLVVATALRTALVELLPNKAMNALIAALDELGEAIGKASAYRIESTLRDFAPHPPVNVWYRFPVHEVDTVGILADAQIKDLIDPVKKAKAVQSSIRASKKEIIEARELESIRSAIDNANLGEPPTVRQTMEYLGLDASDEAAKKRFKRKLPTIDHEIVCVDASLNLYVIKPKAGAHHEG